ncbi:AAA family ATPase [Candidatus Woesearchaeota archaeon]|nr:AAA family ATPase [Candidatus Woesearchaeota archaeon]MBW3018325.1 AAA family ATPase [Candidatus Woesearchaeota archaeon]
MTSNSDSGELDKVMYGYTTEVNVLEDENRVLRETIEHLKDEIRKYKTPPYLVCEIKDLIDGKALVSLKNGNEFFVEIDGEVKELKAGDQVLAHQKNLTVVDKIRSSRKFNVEKFVIIEKPTVNWKDIGGLKDQINEIREVIELPLKKPHLFKQIGIKPPKGVLLHGAPGCGKTILAKAVAASTESTFIQIVGSELVQKYIGEGAKLVKEIFELARNKGPAIVFIDELDAIAARRMDIGTSGEREVQRTFMQLLAELDGFKELDNVKIIGATNRKDILDPAVIRPGRLDRLIRIPEPDKEGIKQIFDIHSKGMKIRKFNKKTLIENMLGCTGADVRAVCTEAGYFAIRDNRDEVHEHDFYDAIDKVRSEETVGTDEFMNMFG